MSSVKCVTYQIIKGFICTVQYIQFIALLAPLKWEIKIGYCTSRGGITYLFLTGAFVKCVKCEMSYIYEITKGFICTVQYLQFIALLVPLKWEIRCLLTHVLDDNRILQF